MAAPAAPAASDDDDDADIMNRYTRDQANVECPNTLVVLTELLA